MNSNYQYKTCRHLADHTLGFFDRIDTGEKCIKFCCEFREPEGVPTLAFKETAEETVDAYLALWKDFMDESKRISSQGGTPEITTGCTKCPLYIDNHWLSDGLIRYVFYRCILRPANAIVHIVIYTRKAKRSFHWMKRRGRLMRNCLM